MTGATKRRAPGGAFRELWSLDWVHYEAHLKRLSLQDRESRFQSAVSEAVIEEHARAALGRRGRVLGWFEGGVLRAAAEIAVTPDGARAEGAFEVEAAYRGRGVGTELVGRSLLWCRNRGVHRLLIHTTRRNIPMLRAARANGAAFEFDVTEAEGVIAAEASNLRSHIVEAAQSVDGMARWIVDRVRAGLRAPFS